MGKKENGALVFYEINDLNVLVVVPISVV